jgi:hypothetical protein
VIPLLLVLWLCLFPAARADKGYGVEVRAAGPGLVSADPGRIVAVTFVVHDATGRPRDLVEQVTLPPGWRTISLLPGIELAAGGTMTRIVAVAVPRDASPGMFDIRYDVVDRRDPGIRDEDSVHVQVATVNGLSLTVENAPEIVVAGETASWRAIVRNNGNTPVQAIVEARGEKHLTVTVDGPAITLAPGESGTVSVSATTERDEARPTDRAVWMTVRASDAKEPAAQVVVSLPIVPRGGRPTDLLRKIPGHVSLAAQYGDGRVRIQPELAAAGAVDADGKVGVDLLARAFDTSSTSAFGLRDEYRFTLDAPVVDAQLGDQVYTLSALTSPWRYGRGAGLVVHPGPVDLGAHYVAPRTGESGSPELAAFTAWHPTSTLVTGLQLLMSGPDLGDTIGSVSAAWSPKSATVAAEAAVDRGADGTTGEAVRGAVTTALGRHLALTAEDVVAGPEFHGYYADLHQGSATLLLRGPAWATLSGDVRFLDRNLALDPGRGAADRTRSGGLDALLSPSPKWSLDVGARAARAFDAMDPSTWAYSEAAGRFRVTTSGTGFGLSVGGLAGPHRDDVTGDSALLTTSDVFVSVFPSPRASLNVSATWSNRDVDRSVLFAPDRTVGLGLTWQPIDALCFDGDVRRSLQDRIAVQSDAQLRWLPKRGPQITARYRLREDEELTAPEHDAMLGLSLPIGVPVGLKRTTGAIRGRVYDADLPGHPGIAGVVVSAGGHYAVTGPDGAYTLADLDAGPQALEADRRRVGVGRVVNVPQPLVVVVRGGHAEVADLGVTDAAELRGRVVLVPASTDTGAGVVALDRVTSEGPTGMSGVVLRISDGRETVTARTAADGTFSVGEMRPGTWVVRIDPGSVPDRLEPVADQWTVVLTSGATRALGDLAVRPKLRPLRMQAP